MDDNNVQLGLWTNYSKGTVLGLTFTTDRTHGNLLVAFTGFFITFVASRFWKISCVVFHRLYSSPEKGDAVYQQRQIIFRNSSSPDSGLFSLFRLMWAWRQLGRSIYGRLAPDILFAVLVIIAFTVAGGLSALISSSTGNEVLLKGDNCGIISSLPQQSDGNAVDIETVFAIPRTYFSGQVNNAANYAQQCYTGNSTGSQGCGKYVVQNLPTAVSDKTARCPFGGDLCLSNSSNIRLDTGYLDSNKHFGLNSPEDQTFSWRYVLQCAPLKTSGYKKIREHDNKNFVGYQYGDLITGPSGNHTLYPVTFVIEDIPSQYQDRVVSTYAGADYRLSISVSTIQNGTTREDDSAFKPRPELIQAGGDVNIVFLSGNGVLFSGPMNGTWYRATTPDTQITSTGFTGFVQGYIPDEAASPMGCVDQYQWCNNAYPGESGCGPLASLLDSIYGAAPLFNLTADLDPSSTTISAEPGARFIWSAMMLAEADGVSLASILFTLGSGALASRGSLFGGVQYPLPEDQWQLDVTSWWNTMLALIQEVFVTVALGPKSINPDFELFQIKPTAPYEQKFCNSQKIRSTSFASFNLFGLLFTYIIGALIVIGSYVLEPLLRWLQKRRHYKEYTFLEWSTHETLQLHRLVQEELGVTKWTGCVDDVPVISSDQTMANLNIRDPQHPIFAMNVAAALKENGSRTSRLEEVRNNTVESVEAPIDHAQSVATPPDVQHTPSRMNDVPEQDYITIPSHHRQM
ncbi:hypothetical protein F4859DRAFT_523049 [Xylaria cf. heliscus]|nr:hypothetical protein F4859DRAFT_523049 [Xylaria cf. heliscus]